MLLMMPAMASCAAATNDEVTAHAAVPIPSIDAPLANHSGKATAVLAGGCFWGMQWVFEHVPGVYYVTSGY
jgi:peptide-methionine (S)-S-oxide reductase